MNIAVAVRLMPNVGDEIEVDDSGTDIDRDQVEMVANDFDEQALEEAVLIKEATGATVIAVGLKEGGMEQALKVAYARGADRVVMVDAGDIDPYDSRSAAIAFAQAFRELSPDLAAELGWPQASVVVGVTADDGSAKVQQEYAGGKLAVLSLELPAVVGVQSASQPPRYVSMARLRQAMSEASTESLSVSVQAPATAPKLVSLERPAPQAGATIIECDPEEVASKILSVLREKGALS